MKEEDWLNHVIPALMFFRSYVLSKNMNLEKFTLHSNSEEFVDVSDPDIKLGNIPLRNNDFLIKDATIKHSSIKKIKEFLDTCNSFFQKEEDEPQEPQTTPAA